MAWNQEDLESTRASSPVLLTPSSTSPTLFEKTLPREKETFGLQEECLTSDIPCPGNVFMTQDWDSGLFLALAEGEVVMTDISSCHGGSYHWKCVERTGWLGFKNYVSGTYLGIASATRVTASYRHHKLGESFHAMHDKRGGYKLYGKTPATQWSDDTASLSVIQFWVPKDTPPRVLLVDNLKLAPRVRFVDVTPKERNDVSPDEEGR